MSAANEETVLKTERDGAVAIVTLNRPKAMNALSEALRAALAKTMQEIAADESVNAVVLTGAGDRAFTAGLDLKELGSGEAQIGVAARASDQDPVTALRQCPVPIIGAINGVAVTGGFEVALACDILYASTNARFADTHSRMGIMPGWGLSQILPRLIGAGRARELSFSGNFLDAETAQDWGLVNRVFAPDQLMPAALKLAHEIAESPRDFIIRYKKLIDDGLRATLAEGLAMEKELNVAWNQNQTPEEIEQRRLAVIARGRKQ